MIHYRTKENQTTSFTIKSIVNSKRRLKRRETKAIANFVEPCQEAISEHFFILGSKRIAFSTVYPEEQTSFLVTEGFPDDALRLSYAVRVKANAFDIT